MVTITVDERNAFRSTTRPVDYTWTRKRDLALDIDSTFLEEAQEFGIGFSMTSFKCNSCPDAVVRHDELSFIL